MKSASSTDRTAKLYRKAAQQMEREGELPLPLCVKRIEGKGLMDNSPAVDKVLEFYGVGEGRAWEWSLEKNRHDLRILALCFMAAMVEAGDA